MGNKNSQVPAVEAGGASGGARQQNPPVTCKNVGELTTKTERAEV